MPSWFRTHGGFAISRTTNRSTAVELWYADDLALVNNEAPNEASIFASFGLPPRGAPTTDPNLPGAICTGHKLVEPAVKIGTTARAKVAVFYDSDIRFRLTARYQQAVKLLEPIPFDIPIVALRSVQSGSYVLRRPEKVILRACWSRIITVRVSGTIDTIINTIQASAGLRYSIGGVNHLLTAFGINELGNGECEIRYEFYTTARVRSVPGGTFGSGHVALPALSNLDEYQCNEVAGTVAIRLATDAYTAGATLPGGIG